MDRILGAPNDGVKQVAAAPKTGSVRLAFVDTWNERLGKARIARGYDNLSEFARLVGVKPPTAHAWESGDIKELKAESLYKICALLKIRQEWLLYGKGEMDLPTSSYENTLPAPDVRRRVPLISWVQAGSWNEAVDLYEPGDGEEWLSCMATCGPNTFALRVQGDSMTAPYGRSYPDGCIIYVDPDQRGGVVSGDRVIAKLSGDNALTFKVLAEDAGRRFLKPLNPQHPIITEPFRVIGKVIGTWIPE